jgi:transposase InsO family protein
MRVSRPFDLVYSGGLVDLDAELPDTKVLFERWRQEYNTLRPHSSLGYRPPAPEAVVPVPPGSATLHQPALAEQEILT